MATFNSGNTVEKAILSVIKHLGSRKIELIIIDGKSHDNTVEIIEKYRSYISVFITEPDTGIYDAWNKGLKFARGDYIAFIGSDDELTENYSNVYLPYLNYSYNLISSNVKLTGLRSNIVIGCSWSSRVQQSKMSIAHVGALHHKSLFTKFGDFDSSFKIAGDFEFLLRARNFIISHYVPVITVIMSDAGISNKMFIKAIYETKKAILLNTNKNRFLVEIFFVRAIVGSLIRSLLRS